MDRMGCNTPSCATKSSVPQNTMRCKNGVVESRLSGTVGTLPDFSAHRAKGLRVSNILKLVILLIYPYRCACGRRQFGASVAYLLWRC